MARYTTRRQRRWRHRPEQSPLEKRQDKWRTLVFKYLRFLGELRNSRLYSDTKWADGMKRHYVRLLEGLLDNPVKGCEAEVEDFRRKLRRL